METITVKSQLDLKTYFWIYLSITYRVRQLLSLAIVFICVNVVLFIDKPFDWVSESICIAILLLFYGLIIPLRIWFVCKKHMRTNASLIQGIIYHINSESIEGIAPDSSAKTNWSLIGKVIEKDNYFIVFNKNAPMMFRYLPKHGFEIADDILKFREMVRANNIRAYFKY